MDEETEKLVCIICPNSCEIEVTTRGGEVLEIKGNLCPRGEEYVRKELFNPERGVTSTVVVSGGNLPLLSVKTSRNIPKGDIFHVMDEIAGVGVKAPVGSGDVVVSNVAGTGADIVATRDVYKKR